jgi:hypothetical protein
MKPKIEFEKMKGKSKEMIVLINDKINIINENK